METSPIQNVGLSSMYMAFEQGGIFIVPHRGHTELQRKQEMEILKILRTFEIFFKNIALTGLNVK